MIFVRYPFHCNVKVLDVGECHVRTDQIKEDIALILGFDDFSLLYNGKRLQDKDVVPDKSTVHVSFSLPGGKGGFGSMLRAIGAQIEKTTNREACRDLSGRRLRDINEEQRLKKWISKEAEREAEKIRRRQARIERLKTKAPHKFFDFEYEKEISELPDRINDALNEGLQKTKQPKKRSHETTESEKIPKKSWIAEEFSGTSSDSDSDGKNGDTKNSPKKRKILPGEFSKPGSSKDFDFTSEESASSESKGEFREESNSDTNVDSSQCEEEKSNLSTSPSSSVSNEDQSTREENERIMEVDTEEGKSSESVVDKKGLPSDVNGAEKDGSDKKSSVCAVNKEPEVKNDSPIELLDFQSVSELEALGLEKLKSALMARGLKCGGTLADRAQRLWKIRDLEPHEYPANLLAKSKK